MNELDKLLYDAKILPAISIQDRINQLQILLNGIELQKIKIKSLDIRIEKDDVLNVYSDELQEIQEKQKETLRGLKNSLRMQTYLLNNAVNREI
jgi:hypothetical protein